MSKEKELIINGIDVSKYFIEVVDEGGGTIGYKLLPNSERLLVEKIFEQNQQLKRLQEENEKLKNKNNDLIEEIASGNIDIAILQKENEKLKARLKTLDDEVLTIEITSDEFERYKKYKQALEEIRNYCDEQNLKADYTACYITNRIDEVLNDN